MPAAEIVAVDLFPEFLEVLQSRAQEAGLTGRIETLAASMDALPFEPESLDLIWSEGAIYNLGFAAVSRGRQPGTRGLEHRIAGSERNAVRRLRPPWGQACSLPFSPCGGMPFSPCGGRPFSPCGGRLVACPDLSKTGHRFSVYQPALPRL